MKIKTFYAASLLFIYSSSAFALAVGEACSSQGSTAHTGSSSGGVSLMCNGSTWVEIVTYNTTGEAHFKKPLKTAAPVANTDVATKEYVDNAVASAGGGGGGKSIKWDDCKVSHNEVKSYSATLTCESGYVLVDHSCTFLKGKNAAYYTGDCYLNDVNSLYLYSYDTSDSYTTTVGGSIKCCKYE